MNLFLFTGLSGVGKSTVARSLVDGTDYSLLGEREILHTLASSRGFSRTRDWLAEVSLRDILKEAREETLNRIKGLGDIPGVMIDGTYDRKLPNYLRDQVENSRLLIVSLSLEQTLREQRLVGRYGGDQVLAQQEMQLIDMWKQRAGLVDLIAKSDIKADNSSTVEACRGVILTELMRQGVPFPRKER
jgi:predicted kinase